MSNMQFMGDFSRRAARYALSDPFYDRNRVDNVPSWDRAPYHIGKLRKRVERSIKRGARVLTAKGV
jgi:hypothetical protein